MSEEKNEITLKSNVKPLYIVKVDVGKLPAKKAEEYMTDVRKALDRWIDTGGGAAIPSTCDVIPILVDVPEVVRRLEKVEKRVEALMAVASINPLGT